MVAAAVSEDKVAGQPGGAGHRLVVVNLDGACAAHHIAHGLDVGVDCHDVIVVVGLGPVGLQDTGGIVRAALRGNGSQGNVVLIVLIAVGHGHGGVEVALIGVQSINGVLPLLCLQIEAGGGIPLEAGLADPVQVAKHRGVEAVAQAKGVLVKGQVLEPLAAADDSRILGKVGIPAGEGGVGRQQVAVVDIVGIGLVEHMDLMGQIRITLAGLITAEKAVQAGCALILFQLCQDLRITVARDVIEHAVTQGVDDAVLPAQPGGVQGSGVPGKIIAIGTLDVIHTALGHQLDCVGQILDIHMVGDPEGGDPVFILVQLLLDLHLAGGHVGAVVSIDGGTAVGHGLDQTGLVNGSDGRIGGDPLQGRIGIHSGAVPVTGDGQLLGGVGILEQPQDILAQDHVGGSVNSRMDLKLVQGQILAVGGIAHAQLPGLDLHIPGSGGSKFHRQAFHAFGHHSAVLGGYLRIGYAVRGGVDVKVHGEAGLVACQRVQDHLGHLLLIQQVGVHIQRRGFCHAGINFGGKAADAHSAAVGQPQVAVQPTVGAEGKALTGHIVNAHIRGGEGAGVKLGLGSDGHGKASQTRGDPQVQHDHKTQQGCQRPLERSGFLAHSTHLHFIQVLTDTLPSF